MTPALDPEGPGLEAALEDAGRALTAALGRAYSVWPWGSFDSDDADGDEWLFPVYAAPDDGDDLGHAVADAGLEGWVEWLAEQAREGL